MDGWESRPLLAQLWESYSEASNYSTPDKLSGFQAVVRGHLPRTLIPDFRRVYRCDGQIERLQFLQVDHFALVDVDGTPCGSRRDWSCITRVGSARAPCDGQLHDALVRLAGIDDPVARPNWNASLPPFLEVVEIGRLDQGTGPARRLAPPVVQLVDPRVDQVGRRQSFRRIALLHACSPSSVRTESPCLPKPVSATVMQLAGDVETEWLTEQSRHSAVGERPAIGLAVLAVDDLVRSVGDAQQRLTAAWARPSAPVVDREP